MPDIVLELFYTAIGTACFFGIMAIIAKLKRKTFTDFVMSNDVGGGDSYGTGDGGHGDSGHGGDCGGGDGGGDCGGGH